MVNWISRKSDVWPDIGRQCDPSALPSNSRYHPSACDPLNLRPNLTCFKFRSNVPHVVAFAGGTASIPCGEGSYSTSNGACKICMFAYLHNEFPRFCSFISVSCGILGNIWKRLERTDTSWKMCAYLRSWDVLSETSPTGGSSISVCISCLPGSYSSTTSERDSLFAALLNCRRVTK